MRILIATYFFRPEATPRAFRAFELARELARIGHEVTVYTRGPANLVEQSPEGFIIRYVKPGFVLNRGQLPSKFLSAGRAMTARGVRRDSWLRHHARRLLEMIYLGGFSFEYAFTLWRALARNESESADLVISIGLPIAVHVGVALYRFGAKKGGVFVADYGDPFSRNLEGPRLRHYEHIERRVLREFDWVVLPLADAAPAYAGLVDLDRVRVIPQGVNFSIAKRKIYVPGRVIRFCYSGIFYKEIRDPSKLFEYLIRRGGDFEFTIFTDFGNFGSMGLIDKYRAALGSRLVLKDLIPREDCIHELSGFDFLVNQRNATGFQAPSKLIDYALADRPVFTFDQNTFDATRFECFLARDFSHSDVIDLTPFDVRTVASSFVALAAEGPCRVPESSGVDQGR